MTISSVYQKPQMSTESSIFNPEVFFLNIATSADDYTTYMCLKSITKGLQLIAPQFKDLLIILLYLFIQEHDSEYAYIHHIKAPPSTIPFSPTFLHKTEMEYVSGAMDQLFGYKCHQKKLNFFIESNLFTYAHCIDHHQVLRCNSIIGFECLQWY